LIGCVCNREGLHYFIFPGENTFLDAGEIAILGSSGKSGTDEIQIDIYHASAESSFIEQYLAFETRFPEAAFNTIFFVCSASNKFIEFSHEPAHARQSQAQLGDPFGIICEGSNVFFEGQQRLWFITVTFRAEHKPASCDLPIRPTGNEIGTSAQNSVKVVGQDGKSTNIDGKNTCQELQPLNEQFFAVGEVAACD